MNALRFFDMKDMQQIEDMYLDEYFLRMEAAQLTRLDKMHDIYAQAWANQAAKATKGRKGRSKYANFDEFFGSEYKKNEFKIRSKRNRGLTRKRRTQAQINRRRDADFRKKLAELEEGESD